MFSQRNRRHTCKSNLHVCFHIHLCFAMDSAQRKNLWLHQENKNKMIITYEKHVNTVLVASPYCFGQRYERITRNFSRASVVKPEEI